MMTDDGMLYYFRPYYCIYPVFYVQLKTEDHAIAYDICQLVAIAVCMRQLLATIHRDYAIVSCRNL